MPALFHIINPFYNMVYLQGINSPIGNYFHPHNLLALTLQVLIFLLTYYFFIFFLPPSIRLSFRLFFIVIHVANIFLPLQMVLPFIFPHFPSFLLCILPSFFLGSSYPSFIPFLHSFAFLLSLLLLFSPSFLPSFAVFHF